ncbi:DUF5615 family PIN-like protein [Candidatus Pacearchaeota archaeon]|nr:DUF5615 family PIN-like protein [Candidatus Pacearchaeota archaeon]
MKFLIDADSPYSFIEIFNKHGHEAVHVRNLFPSASDEEIFEYANKNQYIIVTRDLGFADMFIKNKGFGLVLTRLPYYFKVDRISNIFNEFMDKVDVKELVNAIIVLE